MTRLIGLFQFQKEANLLDSKTYILKSFLAVATAYGIAVNSDIVHKDMISVLFGLMLTLEPVTLTGVRHGWHQMYATILGALSTAVIISIFGIHMITISLSVAFTLYVCLKINWREVSPVAIFTSIYMTQYVQMTASGAPSILLTIQLRLMALGTGIVIAVIFNFLFSFFSYGKMTKKRISFLMKSILDHMVRTSDALKNDDLAELEVNQGRMSTTFNNIDWVYGFLKDIEEERRMKYRVMGGPTEDKGKLIEIVMDLRSICHLNYDIILFLLSNQRETLKISDNQDRIIGKLQDIIHRMGCLEGVFSMESKPCLSAKIETQQYIDDKSQSSRILESLSEMETLVTSLECHVEKY